ncbi:uncharacterized protein LOC132178460 [Corylus avellana]|uniref:uncharacterized protein LOC132178460 n=1 Tax=Corylus avellana TaxID=13451 RepID=UPI00286BAEE8|nr:uncharacterized protein LOC132178460 [Corylus avellana]
MDAYRLCPPPPQTSRIPFHHLPSFLPSPVHPPPSSSLHLSLSFLPPFPVPPSPPPHVSSSLPFPTVPTSPQSYPQANQEWGTSNWGHHQAWNYPAHNNEEDWAARARAWADAKTAMENQHTQSLFPPVGRLEDQSHYYDQYPQSVDAHYPDIQDQSLPASSYQQFPVSGAPLHRPSVVQPQETSSLCSEPSSFVPDAHLTYNARDGTFGDSSAVFHQGNMLPSSSVHQQEVPSSYSSVTGKEDTAGQNEQSYKLLPLSNSSAQEGQHHMQPSHPAAFTYGKPSADSTTNLADLPLDFAPGFNRHDSHMHSSYAHHDSVGHVRGIDPVAAVHSMNNWTPPVAPGLVYPSISSDISSGAQHDPSMAIHSSVPGHAAPPYGRFPGLGQATIPSGGAPFALGAGTTLHPTAAFSGDAFGISSASERPKKASVPNWLKEEIKKAVITSSSVDHPKEETQSIEDEGIDKSFGKSDQADNKSIDSSRSTEEEDDDEDYVEAARTAAVNQEIKRVLTEVLLKVTDELFDEIATKVLSEDDLTVEVDQKTIASNHKEAPSSHPVVLAPKASAKVLIPTLATKDSDTKSDTEKSSSHSPGDILGLANYASDDDNGDDEIRNSSLSNSNQQSSIKKLSEDTHDAAENGISKVELQKDSRSEKNMESGVGKTSSIESKNNNDATISELNDNRVDRDLGHSYSSKLVSEDSDDGITVSGKMLDGTHASRSKNNVGIMESELPGEYATVKKTSSNDPHHSETRMKLDKNDRHESKKSSGKDFVREGDSNKIRADENGDEKRRRRDERHPRKEKGDDWNGSKERMKEQNFEPRVKEKQSESRRSSDHLDVKEDRKETERFHRARAKEDTSRKREHRKDEEEDTSRHKIASESSRHKKRRSSSISSKGRNSKDTSVSHANDSSDEASDDSKRKLQSRKRNSSPSPVRSRRRQISRSPHSKQSQRKHSPYSSLDTTRGRRSRSRSPASQVGLWSIWLSGFVLISLSLYATQRLPSLRDRIKVPKLNYRPLGDLGNPRITIFSAPSPFNGSAGARQSLAVRSWLALSPQITVVLFSQDPSVVSFADAFGSRVLVEPNIDFTFLGTPFFHSMIARSNSFTSDIFVLIDPETILLHDFISTLNYAYELDHDWLLVSSSRNISHFPFYLEEDGKHWRKGNGKWVRTQELQEILSQSWRWNRCEGRMLMAWNSGDLPLHTGVLPPFLYGKGIHNNWVINEAMSSEFRFVFDASWTISSFHLNDQEHWSNGIVGDSRVSDIEKRSWEYVGNCYIGKLYGSLFYREANYSSVVKLLKCEGQYTFINTTENIVYPYGYQSAFSLWKKRILHPWRRRRIMACVEGIKSLDRTLDCSLKDHMKFSEPLDFSFSLESLLPLIADKNKTIVLAVAGYSYKDMLMSWACRLRRLLIKNFMICALDQETYWFSILQGLPVFKDPLAPSNISFNDCHFGTKCFQRVTKVKSRMVLKILKLGYNVLLSDVDVYWFENPLPLLYSFGPAVLVAQSDEYKKTGPINMPRRLNSGFYFAHSDDSTIAAMEKVVKHAATSGLSEQPSFYDTLCGEGGSNRVGDKTCVEPETNLTVYFMDRNLFPNGAYLDLWQKKNVKAACLKRGCLVLHNNWISGRLKKLERQVFSGLWDYDSSTRMCLQSYKAGTS